MLMSTAVVAVWAAGGISSVELKDNLNFSLVPSLSCISSKLCLSLVSCRVGISISMSCSFFDCALSPLQFRVAARHLFANGNF